MQVKSLAANMTEVKLPDGLVLLYSYQTAVAALWPGVGYFRTSQKYSATTSRHISKWLGGVTARELPQFCFDDPAQFRDRVQRALNPPPLPGAPVAQGAAAVAPAAPTRRMNLKRGRSPP